MREANPPIPNIILLRVPVESVPITKLPSFPLPETHEPNKYESFGVVIAYEASANPLPVTHISVNPVVSFVLLFGYTIISLEELTPDDMF